MITNDSCLHAPAKRLEWSVSKKCWPVVRRRCSALGSRLGDSDLSNVLQRTLMDDMPGVPGLEPSETRLG
jgi:hypothetical protein